MAILSEESQNLSDNREWKQYKLFNDESADETTSDEVDVRNAEAICLHVEAGAGVSGGVITLESAPQAGYAGTWKSLGTLTTNAASALFSLNANTTDDGLPARVVRARISTVISGGTIDAYLTVSR